MIELRPKSELKPKKGSLLISEPFLEDPYFKRTVVLLCEHNEEGSFGFVLNKFIDVDVSEILKGFPEINSKVSVGGPVNRNNLYYIHTLGDKVEGSTRIIDGVYLGGDFEVVKEMINAGHIKQNEIRFFVGYSGWSENQLKAEMDERSWIVAATKEKNLMKADEQMWANSLKKMGKKFSMLSNFPEDPSLN